MKKDIIVVLLISGVIFGGSGFFVGRTLGRGPATRQFNGEFRGVVGGPGGASARGAGFVGGEIIAKDETSITVKQQNGSTKIILLSASAQIGKMTEGAVSDLSIGTNVMITGESNQDGSITAQSVQIRPAGSVPVMRIAQ